MKKFLTLLTLLIFGVSWSFAGADFTYEYDEATQSLTLIQAEDVSGEVVIPASAEYDGQFYPVTSIGDKAFGWCSSLTSVTIPDSVTSIGNEAFSLCYGLTSVTIGNSVTSIGNDVFYGCDSLTSIDVNSENPMYASLDGVLFNKNFSTLLKFPAWRWTDYTIPESVTSIGNAAFFECRHLYSVTIPESVLSIGNYAFYECCNLTSVTIPKSVTSIGNGTFNSCARLSSVKIPDSVTSIGDYAFNGCGELTSVTIPESVTSIGNYAFSRCSGLTSVEIPNSVTSIGNGTFDSCSCLNSVIIPDSVISIGESAFDSCKSMDNVYCLAENPPVCNSSAFSGCTEDAMLYVPASSVEDYITVSNDDNSGWSFFKNRIKPYTYIAQFDFEYDSVTQTLILINAENVSGDVVIPESAKYYGNYYPVTSIGYRAFSGCSGLTSVTIPESVTSIGNSAFGWCKGLTSVTIPNSVTSIGDLAFEWCSSLTSVTIPESVTSIGNSAFSDCRGLTSMEIPESVTSIGNGTFNSCSCLNSVIIPESVTSIGSRAFSGCSGLTSVIIPESVTAIGSWAFSGCSGLTSVTIPDSVTSIGNGAFADCTGLTSIEVNSGNQMYVSLDGVLFNKDLSILMQYPGGRRGNYIIPESVTSIVDYTFRSCSGLTSVTIPDSVTSIGYWAFRGCSGVEYVYCLAENPPVCNMFAFSDSNEEAILYVPETSLDDYIATSNDDNSGWSFFRDRIKPYTPVAQFEFEYEYDSKTQSLTLTKAKNVSGDVVIPASAEYDGNYYPVTSIGGSAFIYCTGLTSVTIGNSVTSIGSRAFEGCSGLTSVTIPESVTSIGDGAFGLCSGLTSIKVNSGNPMYASLEGVLFNKELSTLIQLPKGKRGDYIIPDSVTSIGDGAFKDCDGLTSVTIPNSVTSIGDYAFAWCNALTSVTIPNSVTSIGEFAFHCCFGLTSIEVNSGNPMYASLEGVLFNKDLSTLIQCPAGKRGNYIIPDSVTSIGDYAFYMCSGLTSVTIPDSVTSIGDEAFAWCNALTSVMIPESVTSIGYSAFLNCTGLTSVIIPDSVTSIGNAVFCGCSALISANIGKSVTSIGSYAFDECSNLKDVYCLAKNPPVCNSNAFSGCNADAMLYVPVGSVDDYIATSNDDNSGWSFFRDRIYTPVTQFEFEYEYDSKTQSLILSKAKNVSGDVVIPESAEYKGNYYPVTVIGDQAFFGCSGLTSVTIPDSVTSIGDYAFSDCTGLTSVTIPDSVTAIGYGTFFGCNGLTSVTIPDSVTSIGDYAFWDCSSLTSVTIPDSVISIGYCAFKLCNNLQDVYCLAVNPPACDTGTFGKINEDAILYVPSTSLNDYKTASNDNNSGWSFFKYRIYPIVQAEQLIIDPTERVSSEGDTFIIKATVLPENTTDKRLVWKSSDENVAVVSQEGIVSILHDGKCEIIVRTTDGSDLSTVCKIMVMTTGIDGIDADKNAVYEVYSLNGVLVNPSADAEAIRALAPGIYILRNEKGITKLIK